MNDNVAAPSGSGYITFSDAKKPVTTFPTSSYDNFHHNHHPGNDLASFQELDKPLYPDDRNISMRGGVPSYVLAVLSPDEEMTKVFIWITHDLKKKKMNL